MFRFRNSPSVFFRATVEFCDSGSGHCVDVGIVLTIFVIVFFPKITVSAMNMEYLLIRLRLQNGSI